MGKAELLRSLWSKKRFMTRRCDKYNYEISSNVLLITKEHGHGISIYRKCELTDRDRNTESFVGVYSDIFRENSDNIERYSTYSQFSLYNQLQLLDLKKLIVERKCRKAVSNLYRFVVMTISWNKTKPERMNTCACHNFDHLWSFHLKGRTKLLQSFWKKNMEWQRLQYCRSSGETFCSTLS